MKEWSEEFLTGIEVIDKQHKGLFQIISDFAYRLLFEAEEQDAIELIQVLIEYASIHFKDEEEWMENKEYILLDTHRNMHQALLNELDYTIVALEKKEIEDPAHTVLDFALNWLNTHIAEEDLSFSDFCKNQEVLPADILIGKRCEICSINNTLVGMGKIVKIDHPQIYIEKTLGKRDSLRTNDIVKVSIPKLNGLPFAFMSRVKGSNRDEIIVFNAKMLEPLARRRFPRVPCEIPVEILSGGNWNEAQAIDISMNGMALQIDSKLILFEIYPIQFEILNQRIVAKMQIVRIGSSDKKGVFNYGAEVEYETDETIAQYIFYLQGEERAKLSH